MQLIFILLCQLQQALLFVIFSAADFSSLINVLY